MMTPELNSEKARELMAVVQCVECVPITYPFPDADGRTEADPIWRIELGGYCADFEFELAANNFANAINSRITTALTLSRTIAVEDDEQTVEAVARAIEPALWIKIDWWRRAARCYRTTPHDKAGFQDADAAEAMAADCDRKADKNAEHTFNKARAAIAAIRNLSRVGVDSE